MREKLAETERRHGSGVMHRLCFRLRQLATRHSSTGTLVVVSSVAVAALSIGVACYILSLSGDRTPPNALD